MLLLLWLLNSVIQEGATQFPRHVDFQKVGEFIYKNEKYKVLRPSIHIVEDYFADYFLRRDTSDFPTKKVFLDDNGFRHYWSGFEDGNSRKSDKNRADAGAIASSGGETSVYSTQNLLATDNTTADVSKHPDDAKNTDSSDNLRSLDNSDKKDTAIEAQKITELMEKQSSTKRYPKRKKVSKLQDAWFNSFYGPARSNDTIQRTGTDNTKRKIARTTFFCPFIGIITTTAYID